MIRKLLRALIPACVLAGNPVTSIPVAMPVVAAVVLGLAVAQPAQAETWKGTYGVAKVYNFKLYNADGTLDVDEADGGTEVSLSCDQGAETTATNDFADEGNFYSISITAAEMRCRNVAVVIAATTTEVFFIQTDGEAGVIAEGLAQSATGTTIVLASATSFADDILNCATVAITGGTGAGQARTISDWTSASDTATVETWTTTPDNTSTYQVHQTACAAGTLAWNAAWDAEVQSEVADALAVYDPPTNAEMEARTMASANYATAGALDTVDNLLDTEVAAILADTNELQTDWANGGRLDLLIDSIKAKTDPLTFTLTNFLQTDVQYMNATEVLGVGTTADPWNGE